MNGFDVATQLMMGLSLAACAGFRAWLPMFAMGLMARATHLQLNPSFQFLASDGVLIVFGIATVLEFLGDKFIAIDHFLDAVGTVARPVAGTLLASALLIKMDPSTAVILGLITGGGTALTVHAGKALARAKMSLLSPFHGGIGNAALSVGEDLLSTGGVFLAFFAPLIAFFLAMVVLTLAGVMIYMGIKAGRHIFKFLFGNEAPAPNARMPVQA